MSLIFLFFALQSAVQALLIVVICDVKLHTGHSDYRGGNHTKKYQGQINLWALRLSHLKDTPGSTLSVVAFLYFYGPAIVTGAHVPFQDGSAFCT